MPVLSFKGKTVVETYHHTVPHHTLEFNKRLSCLPKGQEPSLDGNLIIEGDNLLALKALLPTHAGRIKCIYIDPPYNTGNEGWVYNDNLTQPQFKEWIGRTVGKEGEDACRHDKWCCMMYPRLMLLKELLRDDGVLLISIDDDEVHRLRMMLAEVFGEGTPGDADANVMAQFAWKSRENTDNRNKTGVSVDHEYIVAVRKTPAFRFRGRDKDLSKYDNPDDDPRGPWMSDNLTGLATAERRPNLHYSIVEPGTGQRYEPPANRGWAYSRSRVNQFVDEGRILWPRDRKRGRPRIKRYVRELESLTTGFSSVILHPYTTHGTREIIEILGQSAFAFPKPSELIRRLVEQGSSEGDIVLDSFSGSGTTAAAVLKLNAAGESDRRFILVQQPYDTKKNKKDKFNICRKITAERVRRVIKGYPFEGTKQETLLEEKVTLTQLKKADELMARVEQVKAENAKRFDEVKTECKNGVVRVIGVKKIKDKAEGLGGSFTYARVSDEPLFGEYRDLGDRLPGYNDIAKYVFYTETSREWDPKDVDKKIGRIGQHGGQSYYLLYRPNRKYDWGLDEKFLTDIAVKDPNPNLVVYCEKIWVHQDQLRKFRQEHGKRIRPMLVPFNLK